MSYARQARRCATAYRCLMMVLFDDAIVYHSLTEEKVDTVDGFKEDLLDS